jgi:hypothetical protein
LVRAVCSAASRRVTDVTHFWAFKTNHVFPRSARAAVIGHASTSG